MEAIFDQIVTSDIIQDAWHCSLFVYFAHAMVKRVKPSSCDVRHTQVRETRRGVEDLHMLVVILRWTISRIFSCSCKCCWRARSGETRALGIASHSRIVLDTLENTPRSRILRIGNRRQYSSTAAVALTSQKPLTISISAHSALVKMCCTLHNTPTVSPSTVATAKTIRMLHTVAQYGGKEGQYWGQIQIPVQWNSSISETVRIRTYVQLEFVA